ncbi:thiol reductant ABC exporter subunit CydC [Nesterenkonia flava]|uniref:Thiol reductant ABC exporter subunit CydC n=1 Tax=Nesterenkonia flava TaxID=469799 RepID=A0ABU1FWE6_9MICC|nr:thiol reductant ABC exporter subunit CydC [Nesterenkonia flava]MDR5712928.1 thiol reductant ABC exporter subunit CydC [Nesterenkonia flava]
MQRSRLRAAVPAPVVAEDLGAAEISEAFRSQVRRQLAAARPSWRSMAPGIAFGALSGLSAVLLIGLSAYLITRAAEQPPILYLGLLVVGVRAFALSRAVFRYLERLSSHDAAFRALGELRGSLFARLEPLAPARLGRHRRGDLLTRVVEDVDALVDWPVRVIQPLVSSGVVVLLTLAATAYFSPAAAVVLAALLAVVLLCGTAISASLTEKAERRTAGLRGRLADAVADLVADLDVLVAFDAAGSQLEKVRSADAQLRREALRASAGTGLVAAALAAGSGAAVVLVVTLALPQLSASTPLGPGFALPPGSIDGPVLAMLALVPLTVFELFAAIPLAWTARRRVLASAARIVEIAPVPTGPAGDELQGADSASPASARPVRAPGAVLEVNDFTVSWHGSCTPVSRPVSFRLEQGENLLLTGPSGAGKTAVAYGLVGFLSHSGTYRIHGKDAAGLSEQELRRMVCLIEQDAHLFDGTLRANLAFAHPHGPEGASDEEIIESLRAVGLWDWACSRAGLETRVGMFGELVSGGQAQRIAVARGLLSGAQVLILDEPTAHVDPAAAESLLLQLLSAAGDSRTVVLLSHLPVPEHLIQHRRRITPAPA